MGRESRAAKRRLLKEAGEEVYATAKEVKLLERWANSGLILPALVIPHVDLSLDKET